MVRRPYILCQLLLQGAYFSLSGPSDLRIWLRTDVRVHGPNSNDWRSVLPPWTGAAMLVWCSRSLYEENISAYGKKTMKIVYDMTRCGFLYIFNLWKYTSDNGNLISLTNKCLDLLELALIETKIFWDKTRNIYAYYRQFKLSTKCLFSTK